MQFYEKGYGRIVTVGKDNIQKIKDIIKKVDPFEYDYMPKNLIVEFDQNVDVIYLHKFYDIDLNRVYSECRKNNIPIGILCGEKSENGYGESSTRDWVDCLKQLVRTNGIDIYTFFDLV